MGNVLAIKGSEVLNALNVGWIPLLIVFIIFCGFINLMDASEHLQNGQFCSCICSDVYEFGNISRADTVRISYF